MKYKAISAIFIIVLTVTTSCTKEKLGNIDYFAFGISHGFCMGNCAVFFEIKEGKIYPDDIDYYNLSTLKFKTDALPVEKYNIAYDLVDKFPSYLLDRPDKTFGCPDCVDQGGYHIEISRDGQVAKWHFDTDISKLPEVLQGYVKSIQAVVEQVK
jgi:hypothetical protein